MGPSVKQADYVGSLVGVWFLAWLFARLFASGYCFMELGHDAAGCRTLGAAGTSAAFPVGGVRVLKTPKLLPSNW